MFPADVIAVLAGGDEVIEVIMMDAATHRIFERRELSSVLTFSQIIHTPDTNMKRPSILKSSAASDRRNDILLIPNSELISESIDDKLTRVIANILETNFIATVSISRNETSEPVPRILTRLGWQQVAAGLESYLCNQRRRSLWCWR